MSKKQKVLEKLIALIKAEKWEIGDRLPSERELSKILNTSRNTLRSVISTLQARKMLKVRKGSGSYLLSKKDPFQEWQEINKEGSQTHLEDQIEALYLLKPSIVALSARKIDDGTIKELEQCVVRLSKTIMTTDIDSIIREKAEFSRIIASSAENQIMMLMMKHLRLADNIIYQLLIRLTDEERERLFASYVDILNAIKNHDAGLAKDLMKKKILWLRERLTICFGIEMPEAEAIRRTIQEDKKISLQ